MPAIVRLKAGREKSLHRRHPWVFSGAVGSVSGDIQPGSTVRLESAEGDFLAWAGCSPASQIYARVWSFEEQDVIDERFMSRRIASAIADRDRCLGERAHGHGRRLVNAEADGLPGLIIDAYGPVAVMQCSTAAADHWRETVADSLIGMGFESVYERSDAEVRQLEGLPARSGPLRGLPPPQPMEVLESGVRLLVDIAHGHKTGMYLDQAANRAIAASHAGGRRVLNCFAYTGGFSLSSLAGGADHVLSIESAADAVALAHLAEARNGIAPQRAGWIVGDVFEELRKLRDARQRFDMVVLDPPKFAPTQAHVERAARAYKDINLLGLKLLAPGGLLATFSCSGAVDAGLFRRIVAGAAEDAGADVLVRSRLGPAPDHSVRLAFPEGDYLKGLLLERL